MITDANIVSRRPRAGGSVAFDAPAARHAAWAPRYARRLWFSDLLVLLGVVYATQQVWFGTGSAEVALREDNRLSSLSYGIFSAVLVALWMVGLALADSRGARVVGAGAAEYVRVAHASFVVFSAVIIACFLMRIDAARGYLLLALPGGILLLLVERHLWRRWLLRQRARGAFSSRALLVGSPSSAEEIARELQRAPEAGYHVVGLCVSDGHDGSAAGGIPVVGGVDDVPAAMAEVGADTVVITSTDELPAFRVKQISWGLEAGRQHLVLAPSIVDVAGPRLHTRPVSGLPLIHVETPRFSRGQLLLKRATDLVAALIGVVLLSPVFAVLALAVRLTSDGPVFFAQTRVGLRGEEFTMLKFRSMVSNAEELLPALAARQRDAGNEVLFKMSDDPRITAVGRVMRRYSLDELPQLFNVIGGSMSLVGPRPPLRSEVDQYADHVHRRFLVKPGITGAWQVGGRSTLSWEESVRLDLSYVENWTLLGDVMIMLRTGKAVLAPGRTAH